nr:MAG TPA: Major tail protein [Caudoviricetes sp.]
MAISTTQGTLITLYRGVPLDMSYNQTVYLSSNSAQTSFFNRYYATNFNNQSYQRVNKNTLRIATDESSILNCNYMSFNNLLTNGTSKTIYAFITNIRYVSNTVTEVDYEIDHLQTWLVEMLNNLEPCFVERMHAASDGVGSNIVPEPISSIDYHDSWISAPNSVNATSIYIAATFNKNFEDATGGFVNGVYSGLAYNLFTTAGEANAFLYDAVDKNLTDGIVSIFMAPDFLRTSSGGDNFAASYNVSIRRPTTCDTYSPKNNKLFTYPFSYILYDNLNGGVSEYKFEQFSNSNTCYFTYYGSLSCKPEVLLVPRNYAGSEINYNCGNYISGYPQCPYATDAFKAWLAQNKFQLGVAGASAATSAALSAIGLSGGNPVGILAGAGMLLNSAKNVSQLGAQIRDMSTRANTAHTANSGTINLAINESAGGFVVRTPNTNSAIIIDAFFTRYGYAQQRIMPLNLHARPHWTYVKTSGFVAKGNIPAYAAAKINAIMDAGITFWNSSSDIGNYSLDNSV